MSTPTRTARAAILGIAAALLLTLGATAPARAAAPEPARAPAPIVQTHRYVEPPRKVERWAERRYDVRVRVVRGNRGMWHPSSCGRSTYRNRVTGCAVLWQHKEPVIKIFARHGAPRRLINNAIKHELAHIEVMRRCGTYRPSWVGHRVERVTSAYADLYLRGSRYWLRDVMNPRPYSWDYRAARWIYRWC